MSKETKNAKFSIWREVVLLIMPILLCIVLDYGFCDLSLMMISAKTILLSTIIMGCLLMLLTACCKKMNRATYILSGFILLLIIINSVKYAYTNMPILLTDIGYLKNIFGITSLVKDDIISNINFSSIIICTIFLTILCFITKKMDFEIKNKKARIGISIVSVLLLVIIFSPIEIKNKILLEKVFCVDERLDYAAIVTCKDYYGRYGVVAGMYGLLLEDENIVPKNYNKEETKKILDEIDNKQSKENLEKPNIIVMFQESYWDITQLEEIVFDKDINEKMNNLKKKGTSAKMLSPSYGGLSCNIEFELLTGGNLGFFTSGYNPFLQMYSKKESERNPSILKELNNNGYYTKVLFGCDYYKSDKIYERLGTNEYQNAIIDKEDYDENVKGEYISDEALVDYVLNELKNKKEDEKLFYMTATIQSHMPYKEDKYKKYDISIKESTLNKEEQGIILSYAQGVYDTNVQIQRLYDEIQKIDEPTIIVVLGDHLPYIPNLEWEDILEKTTLFNTGNEKEDLLRKYTTETLILSNYEDNIKFDTEYVSPDLILTTIINNIDIEISPYYRWLYETRNIMPAQNQYLIIDNESNVYFLNEELPEEIEKLRNKRENIEYYLFKDNK